MMMCVVRNTFAHQLGRFDFMFPTSPSWSYSIEPVVSHLNIGWDKCNPSPSFSLSISLSLSLSSFSLSLSLSLCVCVCVRVCVCVCVCVCVSQPQMSEPLTRISHSAFLVLR
jgi:hypothetical protein